MNENQKHDVFISYKHDPDALTGMFFQLLELHFTQAGITYWYDRDIHAGTEWRKAIDEAIHAARMVLVVVTPEATHSQYVTYEWCYALGLGKKVIPVLLKGTEDDVHKKLEPLQSVDFRRSPQNWDELIKRILDIRQNTDNSGAIIQPDGLFEAIGRVIEAPRRRPLDPDDLITVLMQEGVLTHLHVRKLQNMLSSQRAKPTSSS